MSVGELVMWVLSTLVIISLVAFFVGIYTAAEGDEHGNLVTKTKREKR